MGTNKDHAVQLARWEALLASIAANAAELPQLEAARTDLQRKMAEIQALQAQQGQHQAAKQDATKQIATAMKEARQLATFLGSGVKQRFGKESEKLIAFGLQPFRSKRRGPAEAPAPTPQDPAPPAGSVSGPKTPA